MHILTIDTATPIVIAGIARLADDTIDVHAERCEENARGHAEILTTLIGQCLADSGCQRDDLDAVVVGCGPGPFTGLRVGMATAAAYGDALGLPVYGVCSLDAIAAQIDSDDLLVVTDARRREVYWARYGGNERVAGPDVARPADLQRLLETNPPAGVAGSPEHAPLFGPATDDVIAPNTAGMVAAARAAILSGAPPEALVPLYLRRPDAVEQAAK